MDVCFVCSTINFPLGGSNIMLWGFVSFTTKPSSQYSLDAFVSVHKWLPMIKHFLFVASCFHAFCCFLKGFIAAVLNIFDNPTVFYALVYNENIHAVNSDALRLGAALDNFCWCCSKICRNAQQDYHILTNWTKMHGSVGMLCRYAWHCDVWFVCRCVCALAAVYTHSTPGSSTTK